MRTELESALVGRKFGKVFQLSKFEIAIDFRLPDSLYLFVSSEPSDPRVYLVRRRVRDLERQSTNPTPFALLLKKRVSDASLVSIEQIANERILRFNFEGRDELGNDRRLSLVVQLTGRSANLFLLDERDSILATMRQTRGERQQEGDKYTPPTRPDGSEPGSYSPPARGGVAAASADAVVGVATGFPAVETGLSDARKTLSEHLDELSLEKAAEKKFQSLANSARSKLKSEIAKREKLDGKLNGDLAGHGDADRWKHFGDLLLASVATAKRQDDKIIVIDYFDERLPELEISADENDSITEAAEKYFRKYTKARNAKEEIEKRLLALKSELAKLKAQSSRLEEAIAAKNEDFLRAFTESDKRQPTEKSRGKQADNNSGTRSFVSTDGFEILVGKKAKDNDFLTFRIAKSSDLWMHAADYPGSHVVVRNPNRKDIPHQTLLEAAQLAAFFSQGKAQPKAAVHYTQKKFVNKPRGAAAGLVSLASFKTILVEPTVPEL
jgi:predicted ribosome quality control (RQC) complex YloA/Tae2 family protein